MGKYESREGGTMLDQLLTFCQPKYHDEVRYRYKEMESCISVVLEKVKYMRTCESVLRKNQMNKSKTCFCNTVCRFPKKIARKHWEKRLFMRGSAVSNLLGRIEDMTPPEFILCYNSKVYSMRDCFKQKEKKYCNHGHEMADYVIDHSVKWEEESSLIDCPHYVRRCVESGDGDDLEVFKTYDMFFEFLEIQISNNRVSLYTRECKCQFLNVNT